MEPTTAAARVAPTLPGVRVSRDDVRNALHTHFHSQAGKQQQLRGAAAVTSGKASAGGGSSAANGGLAGASALAGGGRKRVYSFIRVQKKKLSLASKRLFGGGGGGSGGSPSKSYILCVTVQDVGGGANANALTNGVASLHYLQLQSSFAVEVRQSWDIGKLLVIENNGLSSEKKRGAFALFFQDEDTPWQWLVDENETSWAMDEFVWSLCALAIEQKKQAMPRLVRFNLEALGEVAIHQNLPKRYGIDVDLLDHMAALKKKALNDGGGDDNDEDAGGEGNQSQDGKRGKGKNAKSASQQQQQRLTAAENDDAAALLAGVNWNDEQLQAVEEELKKQLRVLEDENITFLLSFESENNQNATPNQPTANSQTSGGAGRPKSSSSATTSVDRIIVAIEALQKRVDFVQAWSNDSSEQLENTSQNMLQFESLNNQLEVHFKNSVALQETLAQLMATIEIPRENMGVLIKPVSIFPDEAPPRSGGFDRGVSQAESEAPQPASQRDLPERLQLTLATIKRVDDAIKSTKVFPASDMTAFRTRGEELAKLAKVFCDKLGLAFDSFLQRRVKQWAALSRQAAAAAASGSSGGSPTKPRASAPTGGFASRDGREISSSVRQDYAASRMSRTITSFASEAEGGRDMDWTFSNEQFHTSLLEYQTFFEAVQSLDPRALNNMRQLYAKHASSVYNPHMQTLFRSLKDKLPKHNSSKGGPHFSKPQALQSWSFHLSASSLGDALQLGAAPLLQQSLDHLVPILTREQHFLSAVFFPTEASEDGNNDSSPADDHDNDDLTLLMEGVFDKMLKRLTDFGEAAAARNILDALSLVVLVNPMLPKFQAQSAFLYNIMVSFQLQMKRLLIKFTEDQESWINAHSHTDTRMAGVLSPIQKTLVMVGRLEECVCGKADDATLAIIYNRMVPTTMQWLEKMSEAKPKYTALARLENYLFISERLTSINPSRELPLGQYAAQAHQRFQENLQLYVAYIWGYEFKQLVPLFDGISELLKTLPAQEIAYHTPRQEARRVLEALNAGFEKSVKAMHDRMKKHFSVNTKMLPLVWGHLVEYGRTRLTTYEKIATDCYQLRLEPTPQRGVELLNKFASSTSTSGVVTASSNANATTSSHSSSG